MRRIVALFSSFVALAVIVGLIPASPADAAEPPTATISGTVRYLEAPNRPVLDRATRGYFVGLKVPGKSKFAYTSELDANSHFTISGIVPGTYWIEIQFRTGGWWLSNLDGTTGGGDEFDLKAGSYQVDPRVPYSEHPLWPEWDRIAGADRYETAVAVSQYTFANTAPAVFLASGQSFADALSAAPIASRQGPLLLTPQAALPSTVRSEIDRLAPSRIYVVGGPSAVSDSVLRSLGKPGRTVERVAGPDRFATSVALAQLQRTVCNTAYIATGLDFPDALAVGGVAGSSWDPVYLVDGRSDRLPASVSASVKKLGCSDFTIVGGTSVVSPGIESELRSIRHQVARFAGTDRWDTARLITAGRMSFQTRHVFLASGLNYPDALAAAAVVANNQNTLYLAHPWCVPGALGLQLKEADPALVTLVGGGLSEGLNLDESWGRASC